MHSGQECTVVYFPEPLPVLHEIGPLGFFLQLLSDLMMTICKCREQCAAIVASFHSPVRMVVVQEQSHDFAVLERRRSVEGRAEDANTTDPVRTASEEQLHNL